ncbi:TIGR04141 family sporadically distributed protein [Archangium violaceum]|nr:TIGR04141 family sporadically distributed protein [Archangium violaceum]
MDNIRMVRDGKTFGELNEKLVHQLNNRDTGKIHLAPPEVIDWETVSFLYPGQASRPDEAHPDLHEDGFFHPERWSIYNCLVAELAKTDALYILSAGQWFKIEKTFAAQILENTKTLVREIDHLPAAQAGEDEGTYNTNAANASKNLVLLDRDNKKAKGARTAIEPCDLFSNSCQFIHVKRKLRSSSLSHLFAQGVVSAETFLSDEKFRKDVKKAVEKKNPALAQLLGNPKDRPDPNQYEVVFAVIAPPTKEKWPQALPFFSQLNLDRTATRLKLLGFRVALHRIDERA